MPLDKFDLFVSPVKNPDPSKNEHFYLQQRLMAKLYNVLETEYGLEPAIQLEDSVWDIPFTDAELEQLRSEPFYISEHYLTRHFIIDPKIVFGKVVDHPVRSRPALDTYNYANGGKWANHQWRVMGAANTGKTLVAMILKEMLENEIPGVTVIQCENPYAFDDWKPMEVPEIYEGAKERLRSMKIKFAPYPRTRITLDDTVEHEANV